MAVVSDMELLQDYDRQGSEKAFAELVQRHLNLVYSVALRHVMITAHAEEIAQVVFMILARKARSLSQDTILEGWLHETTRLTALHFLRGERRRHFREQEAYMQSNLQESTDVSTWNQLAPLLDEALSSLGKKDRDAVMLRFFKEKSLREVAAAASLSEMAAQRRVHRAVGKLRRFFTKRGVVLSAAVLTAAISANSIQAAPVALAKSVIAVALAKGATEGPATIALIKGALKLMAWTKVKTAVVVGVCLLVAGTTTITVNNIRHRAPLGLTLIPAGSFMMGDSLDGGSDAIPVKVYLPAFYMDVNLVSFRQWQSVYYWAINNRYEFANTGAGKAGNHPVQTVNWYDCVKWCNARSQQAGLTPVYYADADLTRVYTSGEVSPYVNWTANGYRLPTEAEWEKATRGGLSGKRYPWGDTISKSHANYQGGGPFSSGYDLGSDGFNATFATGELPYTSPVGAFAPNGYGLYDMAGNVWEWCWDWYGRRYAGGTHPRGPVNGGKRVLRGGFWYGFAHCSRCFNRSNNSPNYANSYVGFRCVRGLPSPAMAMAE